MEFIIPINDLVNWQHGFFSPLLSWSYKPILITSVTGPTWKVFFFITQKNVSGKLLSSELAASSHRCNSKSVRRSAAVVVFDGGFLSSAQMFPGNSHTINTQFQQNTSGWNKKDLEDTTTLQQC